ncbi:MAG: S-layer homology domain-containing protein [Cellulomonas sp.]|nr:S-layer homology domain-containing protein [Cellulomonas sp.]
MCGVVLAATAFVAAAGPAWADVPPPGEGLTFGRDFTGLPEVPEVVRQATLTPSSDQFGPSASSSTTIQASPASSPADVAAASPFSVDISWIISAGVSKPGADGKFGPGDAVSRAAMAAFLYRVAGTPSYTAPSTSSFTDVTTTDPFYKEMSWLASTGVTKPGADGKFGPGDAVSRAAMAAFLYRDAGSPAYTPQVSSPFADVTTTDPFYKEISWLYGQGVTKPGADGRFGPGDPVRREAMAAFLHRWHDLQSPPAGEPQVATASLAQGYALSSYAAALGTVDGRAGSWAVDSGALPSGVSTSGSALSGTPAAPGTYSFTLRFTDMLGRTAYGALSLTVSYPYFGTTDMARLIARHMVDRDPVVDLSAFAGIVTNGDVVDAFLEAATQNAYAPGSDKATLSGTTMTLLSEYSTTAVADLQQRIWTAVSQAVATQTTPTMSAAQKVTVLNDWLDAHATYDYAAYSAYVATGKIDGHLDAYNASGVLLDGTGVCSSYAPALDALVTAAGVQAVVVTGTIESNGVRHAWDKVYVGDAWKAVDPTWNDTDGRAGADQFLLINDSQFTGSAKRTQDAEWMTDSHMASYATP